MKAISIKDPFATLIAEGHKTIETRTWPTKYEGELLICASKVPKTPEELHQIMNQTQLIKLDQLVQDGMEYQPGMAIAVAEIIGCTGFFISMNQFAWTSYDIDDILNSEIKAFHIVNARKIEPFPMKGKLGLWNLTKKEISKIKYL